MWLFSKTQSNLIAFVVALSLIAISFYFQYVMGLQPCPLCVLQRILIIALGGLFFWGLWLRASNWLKLQQLTALFVSLLGLLVSGRHAYLQYFPDHSAPQGCGPSLDFMLQHWPLSKIGHVLFAGGSDCAEIAWQWLGLSMSVWVLTFFLLFAVIMTMNLLRR